MDFAVILALAVREIPEVQFNCQNRKEIDLSNQKITRIPSWLPNQCPSVTSLNAAGNRWLELDSITFKKLETLDINNTGDHSLSAEILSVKYVKFNGKVLGVVLDTPTFENFPPFRPIRWTNWKYAH